MREIDALEVDVRDEIGKIEDDDLGRHPAPYISLMLPGISSR